MNAEPEVPTIGYEIQAELRKVVDLRCIDVASLIDNALKEADAHINCPNCGWPGNPTVAPDQPPRSPEDE